MLRPKLRIQEFWMENDFGRILQSLEAWIWIALSIPIKTGNFLKLKPNALYKKPPCNEGRDVGFDYIGFDLRRKYPIHHMASPIPYRYMKGMDRTNRETVPPLVVDTCLKSIFCSIGVAEPDSVLNTVTHQTGTVVCISSQTALDSVESWDTWVSRLAAKLDRPFGGAHTPLIDLKNLHPIYLREGIRIWKEERAHVQMSPMEDHLREPVRFRPGGHYHCDHEIERSKWKHFKSIRLSLSP